MSPEQVRGEALDARTDLFSLGVVLYEPWLEAIRGDPRFEVLMTHVKHEWEAFEA